MLDTLKHLQPSDFPGIRRGATDTLQVNLGYRCNQQCLHCHVAAGPNRTEVMSEATIDLVLRCITDNDFRTLDLTGGAPELNPGFRRLVSTATARKVRVIDRCNLTVLFEPEQQGLAEFLAKNKVEIVASLPCYLEENVNRQRGNGVFDTSIKALQLLNSLGYGKPDTGLTLNLVYNPQDASLPPPQEQLQADYKRELRQRYNVEFNQLLSLANLPVQRFGSTLLSKGEFHPYVDLLKSSHKPENLTNVMCRSLLSVDWRGYLYDCDFNQMLGLPLPSKDVERPHLRDLVQMTLEGNAIVVADHCYGCTAGQGSSCGGALTQD